MKQLLALTGFAALLVSCNLIDSNLTLDHTPVMSKVTSANSPVFLARVTDRRPDRSRIGCKKNGIGSETADLFLDVPLTDWFGGVMNEEFKRAGLTLAGVDDPATTQIEVDLLDFFIEPDVGMTFQVFAVVHAEVMVRFSDGSGYARRFAARSDDTSMIPTDGAYIDEINSAMRAWLYEAVTEIVRLIHARKTASLKDRMVAWRLTE